LQSLSPQVLAEPRLQEVVEQRLQVPLVE